MPRKIFQKFFQRQSKSFIILVLLVMFGSLICICNKQIHANSQYINLNLQSIRDLQVNQRYYKNVHNKYNGISEKQRLRAIKFKELKNPGHQDLAKEEYDYYQAKYKISQYKQLPFCVVIPSYNNVKNERYKKNIDSIIRQNYSNFHVVFMDDKSTDGTGQKMQKYVNSLDQNIKNKIKIIINSEHQTALPNLVYAARNQCKPQQIYTIVDGDDQLIGRQVLKIYNSIFQKNNVWFIYSNLLLLNNLIGYSRQYPENIIEANSYRRFPRYYVQHLKSFYTKLFLLINDDDLRNKKKQYFTVAYDVAIVYPMLEMAHKRVKYIPQLLYYYNYNTGLNDYKLRGKQQTSISQYLRRKSPYRELQTLFNKFNQQSD